MARYSKTAYVEVEMVLRMLYNNGSAPSRGEAAKAFADMFSADNEQFDRHRFFKACGVNIPMEEQHGKANAQT